MEWDPAHIRALRAALRLSQEQFAYRLGAAPRTVRSWELGAHPPCLALTRALDEAWESATPEQRKRFFAASPVEQDRAWNDAAGDPTRAITDDDEERLARATAGSLHDPGIVDVLSAVLWGQRHAEDLIGSAPLVEPVEAQLAAIEDLVAGARGDLRTKVVDIAGQWAQFAGWLHASTGQPAKAGKRYAQALEYAVEAGDVDLTSEILSMRGQLAWTTGRVAAVIGLSQAAQRDQGAFAGQHAISAAQEARGHAMSGDARATARKLADAERLAAKAAEHPEDAPPWLYYHSPAFFTLQSGLAYRYLGRKAGSWNRRAVEKLEAGLEGLTEELRQSDWAGEYLLQLAIAHVQAHDVDQAAGAALGVVAIADRTHSVRLLAATSRLHARLDAIWPNHPAVIELAESLQSSGSSV